MAVAPLETAVFTFACNPAGILDWELTSVFAAMALKVVPDKVMMTSVAEIAPPAAPSIVKSDTVAE
jgi:hypothetical protein